MASYIIKKLLYGLLVMYGVVTLIFLIFNALPGDPARMMLGQRSDPQALAAINKELGLDKPLWKQYILYLNDLSPISIHESINVDASSFFDEQKYDGVLLFNIGKQKSVALKWPYLRRSYSSKREVSEIISVALPQTALLALVSMTFATLFGVVIGAYIAARKGTWVDNFFLVFTVLGMAGPSFFMAVIIAWLFGFVLAPYTGLNMTGSLYYIDDFGEGTTMQLKNIILPAFTLGIRPLSVVVQLARSSFLDVLSQDFIRTARAKGLSQRDVLINHALRNAMNPVVTAVSGWFAGLLAGAVFIEYIFGWKGLGKEIVDALENYDFPVVMGSVLVISLAFVIINILVDIIYGILDPRVSLK
ncbi:MAG TPA: ABC transporter permease [Bacteroidia bacterium]|nr:ABC transporter permease [Bacteroidia bacterium]